MEEYLQSKLRLFKSLAPKGAPAIDQCRQPAAATCSKRLRAKPA
jgi:hypothetical protein